HPLDDLVEGRPDRREFARDHFLERQRARVEARVQLTEDVRVAEALRDLVEQVDLGDRPVEVEDERSASRAGARHAFDTFAFHTRAPDPARLAAGEEAGNTIRARDPFTPPPAPAPRARAARAARLSQART